MLLRRAMQAGAREFLLQPLSSEMMTDAFTRALARRPKQKKGMGKMFVFVPSKGGVGATTISTTFAMALTKESGARVVAVDMDLQLGEIALGLGMNAAFSIVDALKNADRLDWDFLSSLLIKHRSGLSVLGAPEEYSFFQPENNEAATRLFRILREEFDYIVVDAGTSYGQLQEAIFELADKLYLITELTLPSLRNSHRLITHLSAPNAPNGRRQVEVVVNRFNSRNGDIDEASAVKALGRPINWRVPNGYAAARSAQDNGIPLALESTPITKAVIQMARAACGKPYESGRKPGGGFSFFGSKTVADTVEI
jgi:pilus assembly protein CpaE